MVLQVPKDVIATTSPTPNCTVLAEVPAPSVVTSPGVNLSELMTFCLRLLRASRSEAKRIVDTAGASGDVLALQLTLRRGARRSGRADSATAHAITEQHLSRPR